MVGWQLFQHAVRMIVHNFGFLVRNTLPIWLAFVLLASLVFDGRAIDFTNPEAMQNVGGLLGGSLITIIAYVIATSWIAVVWHRYVLVEEKGQGIVPPFHGRLIWHYFVTGLVNACCLIPVLLVCGIVVGLVGSALFFLGSILPIVIAICFLPVAWVGFRIGIRLPGSALDRPIRLISSWDLTRVHANSIWVLAAIYMLVAFFVPAIIGLIFSWTPVYFIISALVDWLAMLLAASVLTALYGHIVEGRPV